jgi:hypothetical protein
MTSGAPHSNCCTAPCCSSVRLAGARRATSAAACGAPYAGRVGLCPQPGGQLGGDVDLGAVHHGQVEPDGGGSGIHGMARQALLAHQGLDLGAINSAGTPSNSAAAATVSSMGLHRCPSSRASPSK